MTSIAVFCGSSSGNDEVYTQTAYSLGKELASRNIDLIYGGAKIGVMGSVAEGALQNQGKVVGVIPAFLRTREVAHDGLSELIIVNSMHERKHKISELSDAIITLPGGFGTMEEFFEMITWAQLGLHSKPIGILNINGFYDPLIQLIDQMLNQKFLKKINREMVLVSDNIQDLLSLMMEYKAPKVDQWITSKKT